MTEERQAWNVFAITKRPADSWKLFGRLLPQPMIGSFQNEWDFKRHPHFTIATPESGMTNEIKLYVQPVFHVGINIFGIVLNPSQIVEEISQFRACKRFLWREGIADSAGVFNGKVIFLCKVTYPMNSDDDKGTLTLYVVPNHANIMANAQEIEELSVAIPRVPLDNDEDLQFFLKVDRLWQKHDLAQKSPAPSAPSPYASEPMNSIRYFIARLAQKYFIHGTAWVSNTAFLCYLLDESAGFKHEVRLGRLHSAHEETLRKFLHSPVRGSTSVIKTVNAMISLAYPDCEMEFQLIERDRYVALIRTDAPNDIRICEANSRLFTTIRDNLRKQFPTLEYK